MKKAFWLSSVIGLFLFCTACPKLSTVSLLLDGIAAAAEAAAPIIQSATGINSQTGSEISEYLTQVGTGLSSTGAVIDSKASLSTADIAQIVGIWAKITPVVLPSSVPASVRLVIAAVTAAVQAFLGSLRPGVAALAPANAPARTITLTRSDHREASRIAKRGQAIAASMRGVK